MLMYCSLVSIEVETMFARFVSGHFTRPSVKEGAFRGDALWDKS